MSTCFFSAISMNSLVNGRNGTGSHSFGEHIFSGRVDELEKRTPTSCRNQIFHCIHQEASKFQGMLGSNSPEALFKAADSLVDYKASKLRLKASMSGVGIFCANVGRFAAVWLPKSADPKKDAVMAMSRWDTELGGLGLGDVTGVTGDPSLHSVRPKRPRSREDRDLPAIQLRSTKWVPMLVTASVRE